MSYRIQFLVSDSELEELKRQATIEKFPSVTELAKSRILKKKNTYADLYKRMIDIIESLPANKEFELRDIIDAPPALLGRWLAEGVANKTIPNVVPLGRKGPSADRYKKVIPMAKEK